MCQLMTSAGTRYTLSGTYQGELLGIAPMGNRVEIKCHDLDRIEGGKMAESWTHSDALERVMNSGENRIRMRIIRRVRFSEVLCFRHS